MNLCPPLKATKRELKFMARELLQDLKNESICTHEDPASVRTVGCLIEMKDNLSDCELISIFGTYITEATNLDIHTLVTERLQAINQYLQSIQKLNASNLCKSEVKNCDVAFKESDGDYEKICKVMSLLEFLTQWLSRVHC
ncbi:hypothetical protein Q7C36_010623 [Tachysurus vachellii]|uniref:Uncharacterized protein n=1 Tax=Tachysurus vachellii TaxID=175792 RepID=A0AA88MZF6_TACVA|nr:hypothetical protein Q7C36_010623 [Tachysurus vachellii]